MIVDPAEVSHIRHPHGILLGFLSHERPSLHEIPWMKCSGHKVRKVFRIFRTFLPASRDM